VRKLYSYSTRFPPRLIPDSIRNHPPAMSQRKQRRITPRCPTLRRPLFTYATRVIDLEIGLTLEIRSRIWSSRGWRSLYGGAICGELSLRGRWMLRGMNVEVTI
jgi:hypothetical protein